MSDEIVIDADTGSDLHWMSKRVVVWGELPHGGLKALADTFEVTRMDPSQGVMPWEGDTCDAIVLCPGSVENLDVEWFASQCQGHNIPVVEVGDTAQWHTFFLRAANAHEELVQELMRILRLTHGSEVSSLMIQLANEALVTFLRDGTLKFSNMAFKLLAGDCPVDWDDGAHFSQIFKEKPADLFARDSFEAVLQGEGERTLRCVRISRIENGPLTFLCKDVTEHKRLERELEHERAYSIHMAKIATLGEITARIAHEIRTPLAIIQGRCQQMEGLIDAVAAPGVPENLRGLLQKQQNGVQRIEEIIKTLVKQTRNVQADDAADVSLESLLKEAQALLKFRMRDKPVETRFPTDDALKVRLRCREGDLVQVFFNLLSNSYDAVRDLPGPWIGMDVMEGEDICRIMFTDSGAGVPIDIREKVWNPFFTTKPAGKGTGLGLSVSRSLMERNGGSIELVALGDSTCFVLTVKRA